MKREIEDEDKFGKPKTKNNRQIEVDTRPTEVHITNIMDEDISAKQIEELFKQIGIIKERKKKKLIWIARDKQTGKFLHEASVTYNDHETALAAIRCFNGTTKLGNSGEPIQCKLNEWKKPEFVNNNNQFGGRGRPRGRGNDNRRGDNNRHQNNNNNNNRPRFENREGDWTCPKCQNSNFARRFECNKCKEPKQGSSSHNPRREDNNRSQNYDNDKSRKRDDNYNDQNKKSRNYSPKRGGFSNRDY